MFFTSEQRRTTSAYDRFVEDANEAGTHPEVVAALGELASEIQSVINASFLPNFRGGRFVVPENQKNSENIAIVPLTGRQAKRAYLLTEPLEEGIFRTWDANEPILSDTYNLSLSQAAKDGILNDWQTRGSRFVRNDPRGLSRYVLAQASMYTSQIDDNTYGISRPYIMARNALIDAKLSRSVIVHEAVHAIDMLRDGPLFEMVGYVAATELRAYHVGATVCRAFGDVTSSDAQNSFWVEELRQRHIENHERPFTPNETLVHELKRLEKI